jgi:hypothetical protein
MKNTFAAAFAFLVASASAATLPDLESLPPPTGFAPLNITLVNDGELQKRQDGGVSNSSFSQQERPILSAISNTFMSHLGLHMPRYQLGKLRLCQAAMESVHSARFALVFCSLAYLCNFDSVTTNSEPRWHTISSIGPDEYNVIVAYE